MIVLSLFDGMACGYAALKRAGIYVEKYYASEIDPWAIKIAKKNHPNIVHLGDVTRWREWSIPQPDLIIGGSPCQGFSFAGKQLAFDDPRSKLFFDMIDIIDHFNPKFRFLENVKMKKEFLDIITKYMACEPHFINSALVSAQNRQRYYWYNWEAPDPVDRGILLADILEQTGQFLSEKELNYMNRPVKDGRNHWDFGHHSDSKNPKSAAIVANFSKGVPYNVLVQGARIVGRRLNEDGKRDDYNQYIKAEQRLELRDDFKAGCLTTVQKDSVVVEQRGRGNNPGFQKEVEKSPTLTSHRWEHNVKVQVNREKSKTLRVGGFTSQPDDRQEWNNIAVNGEYRKFTPVECERLQTLPDGYTEGVSNSQRYKMLGNGWTMEVIAHLFSHIPLNELERMM